MSITNFDDEDDFTNLDRGNDFEESEDEDEEDEDQEDEESEEESDEDNEDSDDDESEETEEDQDDEDEEKEPAPKSKDIKIPKARLDKALKKIRDQNERTLWLEEQLEKLINSQTRQTQVVQTPPAPTYDFDVAEEQYATFLIEGDTVKAAKLRREIDSERQKEIRTLISDIKKSNDDEVTAKVKDATETEKFNTLIKNYENKYPFLDADNDDSNEEAIDTVNALMSGYLAKGASKSEALKKAIEKVAPMYAKSEPVKKSLGKERKIEAGKKAAQASKNQPTKTKSSTSTNIDTSKLNIAKMSERAFDKLTPRERKVLRGD